MEDSLLPNKISITIYNSTGNVVKQFTCQSTSDVLWTYEMIDGVRTLNLTQELQTFANSSAIKETQDHFLLCSYFKFGEMQQERADFTVIFERCD